MSSLSTFCAVVLAAGAGTRMKSRRSKVLHPLAGRPLLHYPVLASLRAGASQVVVVASPANQGAVHECMSLLAAELKPGQRVDVAIQQRPLGTGDAARAALPHVSHEQVLILCGDTPLVRSSDLRSLIDAASDGGALALLSCALDDPSGYGRILRDERSGAVLGVREQKDLRSDDERNVREVNAGIYFLGKAALASALGGLTNKNASGEYYLTDIVAELAVRERVLAVTGDSAALQGVNDRVQLDRMEQALFARIREQHQRNGVTIQPSVQIDDTVEIGSDTTLLAGVALRGKTRLGEGVRVDQGSVIEDSDIAAGTVIKPHCVITQSQVGPHSQLGPFAHLRPQSVLEAEVHVGNFVETKNTTLRSGAKANHLAYLGDGDVGEGANIGAGTIFCNYDGFAKWRTVIGKGAFIGSDSQLIAPIEVGDGAYVGTGTTLTESVPAGGLALSRVVQTNKPDYAVKLRTKLAERAKNKR
jgi:bifunctional UDP-N-acetylglucosamine pyrophosphorylase / glucosamine-1-phosphate N-acetyltransferase